MGIWRGEDLQRIARNLGQCQRHVDISNGVKLPTCGHLGISVSLTLKVVLLQ